MWKVKVKTWGYSDNTFKPVEFEIKVKDEELVSFMNFMQDSMIHDVSFFIERVTEEKGE